LFKLCPVDCGRGRGLELPTNIRQVSQSPEKASLRLNSGFKDLC
jgi:hypothetical protein